MDAGEARRIEHGVAWGAAATAISGVVVLGAVGLGVWPTGKPLSVLFTELIGRQYLGGEGAPWATWLLAGAVYIAWGAACGGMLAVLADRVTLAHALGLGALRWMFTNTIVVTALGYGDFGLLEKPSLALATAVPHLVYALCLGWLMHQEDEGHALFPLHLHWRLSHARRH